MSNVVSLESVQHHSVNTLPPLITSVPEPYNVKVPLTDEVGTDDPDEAVDKAVSKDTGKEDSETGGRNGTLAASFPCTTV